MCPTIRHNADAAQGGLAIKVTWKHGEWAAAGSVYYGVVEAGDDGKSGGGSPCTVAGDDVR